MWVFGGLRRSVGLGVLNECQTRKMGVTLGALYGTESKSKGTL